MKRSEIYALIIYFMSLFGVKAFLDYIDIDVKTRAMINLVIFPVILVLLIFILRRELEQPLFKGRPISFGKVILWIIGGFIAVIAAQKFAVLLKERLLGIEPEGAATDSLIRALPFLIVSSSFFAPITEEIIFRRIIARFLIVRINPFTGIILSAVIFAAIHLSWQGFLNLFFVGIILGYSFYKTNRLLVPFGIHILLNLLIDIIELIA
ncbi:CPBP family intramembrane glutamic endopeptidase [Neobacillus terrae]|uniref:CPBP family intramembrane glutamic endopeptidase n=1 Tax=Neobacillus terrae TaxID=3034837 RepID=UPI00140BC5FC|nr:type II CAAX endopeptidase family protein [Neobacillus terrae]NHM31042.1 CPBP family intramembrane metalloprotease [Neobacillus terrae]